MSLRDKGVDRFLMPSLGSNPSGIGPPVCPTPEQLRLIVKRQVGRLPYTREQRGADLSLSLLLLLSLCTKSETPWTGRAETCPTTCQNEFPGKTDS